MKTKFKITICALGLAALAGCSSTPTVNELPATADANQEMSRLDSEMKVAQQDQINVLAPQNFDKASGALSSAKEAQSDNKDQKTILHKIAVAQAYLDKAQQDAAVAAQVIPDVVKNRKAALDAQVIQYHGKEMATADNDLKEVTSAVEDNDTSLAEKNRGSLASRYDDLELSSIKKAKLGPAGDIIEQAKKEGAEKLVPDTLGWADQKMKQDDAIVSQNRHDTAAIEKAANDSAYAATRVLNLTRHAKASTAQNPEQIAKKWEADQMALAQKETVLNKVTGEVGSLSDENKELSKNTKVDRDYDFASKQFSDDEAEVYKQGDKLVLRLKGLNFPTGQAVITPDNYPLLAKVQKVIQESDPQGVVIEGHTDARGGKRVNMKLSDQRAKSVESYLVSNESVDENLVTAKGYGDTRPIASNKTKIGREQNRRVDIIISSRTDLPSQEQIQSEGSPDSPSTEHTDRTRKTIVQ